MIPLFLGLTFFNLLCLTITTLLGYGVMFYGGRFAQYHQLAGVLTTICCCAVHCIVFTYFIATAKWIQHAIEVKHLDPSLAAPTRSFKAQSLPAALGAMTIVFITAVVGVATIGYGLKPMWHHGLAILSIIINALAAIPEYRAISRNGLLIDALLIQINGPADPSR